MKHKEKWDFYFDNVDDKPGSFYLDLGLAEVAPVHTMPHLICICLKMNDPIEEDGLSSDREYDKLLEIEDHLFDSLKSKHDIIYAGRLTSNGKREFYLYRGETLLLEKTLSESFVRFPDYEYDFEVKEDKEWRCYFGFLYPDGKQLQSILNRRVIETLEEHGDKLTQPRELTTGFTSDQMRTEKTTLKG